MRERATPEEEAAGFVSLAATLTAALEEDRTADLEPTLGPLIDRLLLAKGIARVDAESRPVLLAAFAAALRDASETRKRNVGGDYSPDPKANRFPEWQPPEEHRAASKPKPAAASPKTTLTGLVDAWWTERKAAGLKPSTHERYRATFVALVAYLKHDYAGRVTPDDVVGFTGDSA